MVILLSQIMLMVKKGDNIRLSIDLELQSFADELITNELTTCNSFNTYFNKMYFVMMNLIMEKF
mgnify:CR=1 FL=1